MNYFALIPPNPPTPKFRIRKLIRGKSSSWENLRGKYTEILMGKYNKNTAVQFLCSTCEENGKFVVIYENGKSVVIFVIILVVIILLVIIKFLWRTLKECKLFLELADSRLFRLRAAALRLTRSISVLYFLFFARSAKKKFSDIVENTHRKSVIPPNPATPKFRIRKLIRGHRCPRINFAYTP